jgi:hypothetical protein
MKRSLLSGLGLTLLGSLQLAGCAETGDMECLPGDIDCADLSGADGKADAWDAKNDPRRFSQTLNYRLAELPKRGTLDKPVWADRYPEAVGKAAIAWADTYWPTYEGSHNHRWRGASVKSPLEKYDAAFNNAQGCETQPAKIHGANAKALWDAYYQCAGPAAKWQSKNYQNGSRMHDGIDNDGDGTIDDYGSDRSTGIDGIQTWWGTCHAWAPAALMMPEPQRAVELNGQRFEIADIKALVQNIYDRTSAVMLGGRCNAKEITHGPDTSANDECADINPGAFHVVMTNFIGIANLPLVEDRTANYEVWNQPVVAYEVTQQRQVSKTAANQCVGSPNTTTWSYNPNAKKLYEVRMTVTYVTESGAEARVIGYQNHKAYDNYHYILELNDDGKVIGGRYCTDSAAQHVDFLWSPTGQHGSSNPSVDVAKVKQLLKLSLQPEGGSGATTTRDFPVTPNLSIPDNNTTGVSIDIPVSGVTNAKGLSVAVDITHTYRGDLVLRLFKNGTLVKELAKNQGGSAQNLVETYQLTQAEIGSDVNARWTLQVADTYAQDVGKVNKVTLSFAL